MLKYVCGGGYHLFDTRRNAYNFHPHLFYQKYNILFDKKNPVIERCLLLQQNFVLKWDKCVYACALGVCVCVNVRIMCVKFIKTPKNIKLSMLLSIQIFVTCTYFFYCANENEKFVQANKAQITIFDWKKREFFFFNFPLFI